MMSRSPFATRSLPLFFAAVAMLIALGGAVAFAGEIAPNDPAGEVEIAETNGPAAAVDVNSYLPEWLQGRLMGVSIGQFLAAFISILLGLTLKKVSDYVFRAKLIPLLDRTPYDIDNLYGYRRERSRRVADLPARLRGGVRSLAVAHRAERRGLRLRSD